MALKLSHDLHNQHFRCKLLVRTAISPTPQHVRVHVSVVTPFSSPGTTGPVVHCG